MADKIKVLIADDVSGLRDLLKTHLRGFNCEVCKEVDDGRKVIEAIKQTNPDMVFLDIDMPGENGLEVLKKISEQQIHDKVWIISGDENKLSISLAREYGARNFIRKPFTMENIESAVSLYQDIIKKELTLGKSPGAKATRVLIADDEKLMLELLEKVLVKNDCTIEYRALSGHKVIEQFESGEIPEMTFLDIEMPDGNGLDVLSYIKEKNISTFTVMVSAHGTFENVQSAMESGADGFVVKPYSEKKIQQVIKKYRSRLN